MAKHTVLLTAGMAVLSLMLTACGNGDRGIDGLHQRYRTRGRCA